MTDKSEPRSASANFARNVRRLRKEYGWSQAEVSSLLGTAGHPLGQSRIAEIEAGASVSIDQAAAFAAVLAVPVEMLLYEQPPPTQAVQIQRLYSIAETAKQLHEKTLGLIEAIGEGMPGRLPSGTVIAHSRPAKRKGE